MSNIQKLIDKVRTNDPKSLNEIRINEICGAAQRELDKLWAESMCYNFTSNEHSIEHFVEL